MGRPSSRSCLSGAERLRYWLFQLVYLVYVSLEWRAGVRGGGTHQWNLTYDDFKHNLWVYQTIFTSIVLSPK